MLGELTLEQRVRLGELAQELIELGLLPGIAQQLTGNYIETLTKLEPENTIGRDQITLRLTVLGEIMNTVTSAIHTMQGDGDMAAEELMRTSPNDD